MAQVHNNGISVSPDTADAIDDIVDSYVVAREWPSPASPSFALHRALQDNLISISSDGRLVPSLRGLAVCSVWPVLSDAIVDYWRFLCSHRSNRNRMEILTYRFPLHFRDEVKSLFAWVAYANCWFGSHYELLNPTKPEGLRVSLPLSTEYYGRLGSRYSDLLAHLIDLSAPMTTCSVTPTMTTRHHGDMRSQEAKIHSLVVEKALAIPIVPPLWAPTWLRRIISDYVEEADRALKSGAPFAAVVIFGAAIESLLAARFSSRPLPLDSPAVAERSQLHEDFKIKLLMDRAREDLSTNSELASRLGRVRDWRNGIHANLYTETSSMITLMDAIMARATVADLAMWVVSIGPKPL